MNILKLSYNQTVGLVILLITFTCLAVVAPFLWRVWIESRRISELRSIGAHVTTVDLLPGSLHKRLPDQLTEWCLGVKNVHVSRSKIPAANWPSMKGARYLESVDIVIPFDQMRGALDLRNCPLLRSVEIHYLDTSKLPEEDYLNFEKILLHGNRALKNLELTVGTLDCVQGWEDLDSIETLSLCFYRKEFVPIASPGSLTKLSIRDMQANPLPEWLRDCKNLEALNLLVRHKSEQLDLRGLTNLKEVYLTVTNKGSRYNFPNSLQTMTLATGHIESCNFSAPPANLSLSNVLNRDKPVEDLLPKSWHTHLKSLHFSTTSHDGTGHIDLGYFPSLTYLSCAADYRILGLPASKLQSLSANCPDIVGLKPGDLDHFNSLYLILNEPLAKGYPPKWVEIQKRDDDGWYYTGEK